MLVSLIDLVNIPAEQVPSILFLQVILVCWTMPWVLVSQNIGHLSTSSLNALQLPIFAAWGLCLWLVPKTSAEICVQEGEHNSLFKFHCPHHLSCVLHIIKRVSAVFFFFFITKQIILWKCKQCLSIQEQLQKCPTKAILLIDKAATWLFCNNRGNSRVPISH